MASLLADGPVGKLHNYSNPQLSFLDFSQKKTNTKSVRTTYIVVNIKFGVKFLVSVNVLLSNSQSTICHHEHYPVSLILLQQLSTEVKNSFLGNCSF